MTIVFVEPKETVVAGNNYFVILISVVYEEDGKSKHKWVVEDYFGARSEVESYEAGVEYLSQNAWAD